MKNQIQEFIYEGQPVEFDIADDKLMVNATEMARIFGKKTENFLRNEQTQAFIQECLSYANSRNSNGLSYGNSRNSDDLKNANSRNSDELKNGNSRFLGIEKESDLYTSRQRSGTWMHRILALKFAAWLDPRFEIWVYLTIDQIVQGKQSVPVETVAERRRVMTEIQQEAEEARRIEAELLQSDVYQRWLTSQEKIKTGNSRLKSLNKQVIGQLDMFASQ
ncbi:hypothetical protein GCM10027578_22130 [Spirosoma luteolum]